MKLIPVCKVCDGSKWELGWGIRVCSCDNGSMLSRSISFVAGFIPFAFGTVIGFMWSQNLSNGNWGWGCDGGSMRSLLVASVAWWGCAGHHHPVNVAGFIPFAFGIEMCPQIFSSWIGHGTLLHCFLFQQQVDVVGNCSPKLSYWNATEKHTISTG